MTGDWERLAELAVRRRAHLRLTQMQVAELGPLSLDRIQAIEGAKRGRYRVATLAALERALRWMPGSVDQILNGGEPTPIPEPRREPSVSEVVAEAHRDLDRLEALERELARRVTAARKSPKDLERAVTALRLVQGDTGDSGAN